MMTDAVKTENTNEMGPTERNAWRIVQGAVLLVGLSILVALFVRPTLGLHAFWDVLIPVAPALLVFAPGVWRNICPMATSALLPRHLGLSSRRKPSRVWADWFGLIGITALLVIVPLRHVVLDLSGPATAFMLIAIVAVAMSSGFLVEWKSAWCAGLCPILPVEKLYGRATAVTVGNAHCTNCESCVAFCPDSAQAVDPVQGAVGGARRFAGTVLLGGFPGYIWGWFQVRDYANGVGWSHLASAYGMPFFGLVASLLVFLALRTWLPQERRQLARIFTAAAISTYYWYRLPALLGFGLFPGDGMLVDLSGALPAWFPVASRIATTLLFFWWLAVRGNVRRSWLQRPPPRMNQTNSLR